ncbi:hypothetical protein EBI_26515 [Enterocytozoon bieneusi H348]|nr:hypothetical protein EBI_26515 [Enterocytozoon bieneusi H348]|eukprot:XP_002650905.1 hypothetical protein EBI_26515 [Enterocytozoon bieneusi H348]
MKKNLGGGPKKKFFVSPNFFIWAELGEKMGFKKFKI